MESFLVRLVFCVHVGGEPDQFDEQLRLITANSEHDALIAAERVGKGYSEEFCTADGTAVSWIFAGVTGCQPLYDRRDTDILFTGTVRDPDVTGYLAYVHRRWQHLLTEAEEKSVAERSATI